MIQIIDTARFSDGLKRRLSQNILEFHNNYLAQIFVNLNLQIWNLNNFINFQDMLASEVVDCMVYCA